jgi:hypothetical protein
MDSGYHAAFTGLIARMDALDVIANNLANVSITGFRGQHEFHEAVTANAGTPAMSPLRLFPARLPGRAASASASAPCWFVTCSLTRRTSQPPAR